ncbi:TIGR02444 family protein [Hydrogenophaga sp. BPS33]|uniref:TIGR02444 family protein n=1 Tax=Hydrogenophaga sp. BPS33 TaxID=2651974 RepID=UPI0013202F6A|nr:TIGR02444 family protein [Hydrogenophaga sp. BPS33]QHE87099.1 TIGR02444 family protein [Hydrogenophaga sp. BPS33]
MATAEPAFLRSDEWRHVLALYGRPGVAQACLLLQDRLGVDVVVLLHLGYVERQRQCPLQASHVNAADAVVRDWREQVLRPLRRVARWPRTILGRRR